MPNHPSTTQRVNGFDTAGRGGRSSKASRDTMPAMSEAHRAISAILRSRTLALHELKDELWKREMYLSETSISARIRELKDEAGERLVQCRKDEKWFVYFIPGQQEMFAEVA